MASPWCQSKLHKWKGMLRFIVGHEGFIQQIIRTKVISKMIRQYSHLNPTLRMDVMSLCVLCWAGLKSSCQVTGKYARDLQKARLKRSCTCGDALWCCVYSQSGIKLSQITRHKHSVSVVKSAIIKIHEQKAKHQMNKWYSIALFFSWMLNGWIDCGRLLQSDGARYKY